MPEVTEQLYPAQLMPFEEAASYDLPFYDRQIASLRIRVLSDRERTFMADHNSERAKAGVPALTWLPPLTMIATIRSDTLATPGAPFTHEDMSKPGTAAYANLISRILADQPWLWGGENLCMTWAHPTAEQDAEFAIGLLMASPGHRANILSPDFTHIGVACTQRKLDGYLFWTTIFLGLPT